ncbi:hypothetical protein PZA11_003070 [Diplocarpon coronariae]
MFPGHTHMMPGNIDLFNQALARGFMPAMDPLALQQSLDAYFYQRLQQQQLQQLQFQQQQTELPCTGSCYEGRDNRNSEQELDFKTKDVTVRGKARAVRATYLIEAPKFESDLVKYMEKKKEDDVPERVVDMLISWINREQYPNEDLFDEVTLHILASNVGCKSIQEQSLKKLKGMEENLDPAELFRIVGTVYLSSKVDKDLKGWLVKLLRKGYGPAQIPMWRCLEECDDRYMTMMIQRPEIKAEVYRALGFWSEPNDEGFRTL